MDEERLIRYRKRVQEELAKLPEHERNAILERRAQRAEEIKNLPTPEQMLAEIHARCDALKKAGLYDADKIERELKEQIAESNKQIDILLGRISK